MSKQPVPGWVTVNGRVPVAEAMAEYERLKALLPPGTPITADMMRPWLNAQRGTTNGVQRRQRTSASQPVERRGPGRRPWTSARFHQRYRDAIAEVGADARDIDIAQSSAFGYADARQLSRLAKRFGRPVVE